METHAHHLHNPDSHRDRKNFWHYFFEFFMLFLAVFCGFLAENFREHQIEKERGIQYIESFYEDLKADTQIVSIIIEDDKTKIDGLENLSTCFNTITANKNETSCLLEVLRYTGSFKDFRLTDRTLNQLKNAGGFRLLKKVDADSILKYIALNDFYQAFQTTILQTSQDNVRNSFNKIISFGTTSQIFKLSVGQDLRTFDQNFSGQIVLASDDKNLLNQYFNELFVYYRVIIASQTRLKALKQNQIRLINYFKDKYHFD